MGVEGRGGGKKIGSQPEEEREREREAKVWKGGGEG